MKHVGSFSGGAGSWAAMKRVAQSEPLDQIVLLFADTIVEDQDTYRFLIEGAANVFGLSRPRALLRRAMELPELSLDDLGCERRKAALSELRRDVMKRIPGLVWIADGRHPWEVFEYKRFIGNSSLDPCSLYLKRQLIDEWHRHNCDPIKTVCYVGIDWSEKHRFIGTEKRAGIEKRTRDAGWTYKAPLIAPPFLTKEGVLKWLDDEGVKPPRAYGLGFPHNNCGGFCVKAGIAHFALFYRQWPQRFAWHEHWEEKLRATLGDYSMLKDRRGGIQKSLPLRKLRERIESGECFGNEEWGGCGCALP